jgi:hypothetical protein
MEIKEYYKYRKDLLDEAKDSDGFINESQFLEIVLPMMLDAKLVDSEEFNYTLFNQIHEGNSLKLNAYTENESGERLQLFIVNEESIDPDFEGIEVSEKAYYESYFKKAFDFIRKARNSYLDDIQLEGALNVLINKISNNIGAEQFDVIEIFLISATATVERRGQIPSSKRIDFKDEILNVKVKQGNETRTKVILVLKKLIDLNFLYDILISQGNREDLIIDFQEQFGNPIKAIKAADEENFTSYLCALPAPVLAKLYLRYSSRLLEKNVRSFLQFKGVNQGLKRTLTKEPEKFIAYNNGLTITAKDMEVQKVDEEIYLIQSLTDFQIVNGGQTTASIYFSNKEGVDISKVRVMAKINVAKNSTNEQLNDLISKISEYSNSQSKVSSVDLRSSNPQLNRIKALSESVITPSNKKWFFEKSKGEFNTKLRIAGSSGKTKLEKEYPRNFRFTKEQIGKYFSAWGDEPFDVKKGGERIFRKFIEYLDGEEKSKKVVVNRNFYELLISKIILFKSMMDIHGTHNQALGQLRSAVVPYSISVLYNMTDGNRKGGLVFNLFKFWKTEGLENDLAIYVKDLMVLVNGLLIKYSKSGDVGEWTKKKECWDILSTSKEIVQFVNSEDSKKIIAKYTISKKEMESLILEVNEYKEVDFGLLKANVDIHSKTTTFFKSLINEIGAELDNIDIERIDLICHNITNQNELTESSLDFAQSLLLSVRGNNPEVFDKIRISENDGLVIALDFIIEQYNNTLENSGNIISNFDRLSKIAQVKGLKYDSIYLQIGKQLKDGLVPTVKQLTLISESVKYMK